MGVGEGAKFFGVVQDFFKGPKGGANFFKGPKGGQFFFSTGGPVFFAVCNRGARKN